MSKRTTSSLGRLASAKGSVRRGPAVGTGPSGSIGAVNVAFLRVGRKSRAALEEGSVRSVPVGRADMVVLPRDEYERLVDAADANPAVAAYARTRGEETVPNAVAKRLALGENPIRVWREHRGLTLDQLGAAIGKRKGFLSEIESGKKTGSIETLRAIANALQVDLDDLV